MSVMTSGCPVVRTRPVSVLPEGVRAGRGHSGGMPDAPARVSSSPSWVSRISAVGAPAARASTAANLLTPLSSTPDGFMRT
jgi:hypothetical protein